MQIWAASPVSVVAANDPWIDSEVEIDLGDGMPVECAISLENLRTIPRVLLTEPFTRLDAMRMNAVCRALTAATGC